MGVGALAALAAAFFWTATNLILREQIGKVGGATAQAWRTVVSTLVFAPVFLALRGPADVRAIPARTVGVLLLAVLLSMVIGDILQFTAIRLFWLVGTSACGSSSTLRAGTYCGVRRVLGRPVVLAGYSVRP